MHRLKKILPFLILFTVFLALVHFFIYSMAVHSLDAEDPVRNCLFSIFAGGVFIMPIGMIVSMSPWRKILSPVTLLGYLWMGFFPIVWFFSLLELAVSFVYPHPYSLWVLVAATVISLWAIYGGLRAPKVVTHKIAAPEFLRGMRLVQISDLHVGMFFLRKKWLQKITDRVRLLNPDAIAITGDLTDGVYKEVAPMLEPLRELNPALGKYYITGNHEYIREGLWEHRLAELGFQVLHNSHKIIHRNGENLMIAGIPDRSVSRFQKDLYSNPEVALKTSTKTGYRILLAHQPLSVFEIKTEKCDLMLSGHTHAGQIFPFRFFVRLQQPMVAGFKKLNNILVFAHQGTGHWGPPMRWFTRAEIVVFEF